MDAKEVASRSTFLGNFQGGVTINLNVKDVDFGVLGRSTASTIKVIQKKVGNPFFKEATFIEETISIDTQMGRSTTYKIDSVGIEVNQTPNIHTTRTVENFQENTNSFQAVEEHLNFVVFQAVFNNRDAKLYRGNSKDKRQLRVDPSEGEKLDLNKIRV